MVIFIKCTRLAIKKIKKMVQNLNINFNLFFTRVVVDFNVT